MNFILDVLMYFKFLIHILCIIKSSTNSLCYRWVHLDVVSDRNSLVCILIETTIHASIWNSWCVLLSVGLLLQYFNSFLSLLHQQFGFNSSNYFLLIDWSVQVYEVWISGVEKICIRGQVEHGVPSSFLIIRISTICVCNCSFSQLVGSRQLWTSSVDMWHGQRPLMSCTLHWRFRFQCWVEFMAACFLGVSEALRFIRIAKYLLSCRINHTIR